MASTRDNLLIASFRWGQIVDSDGRVFKDARLFPGGVEAGRPPSPETVDEYRRVQKLAASDDKPLNKAVGLALAAALKSDAYDVRIITEKRSLPNSTLQPDIQVWLSDAELICLEPTWRTMGKGIKGGIAETQNSMTPGNIQKYLLGKIFDYVTSLKL